MAPHPTPPAWRFISFPDAEVEQVPPGKTHYWYCKPGMVLDTNLNLVRAQLQPGEAHKFHHHPHMEEILYILSGTAEQWVEREKRLMRAGDSLYLPAGIIHGTYNVSAEPLDFLAILAPAKNPGPFTVDDSELEPWEIVASMSKRLEGLAPDSAAGKARRGRRKRNSVDQLPAVEKRFTSSDARVWKGLPPR